MKSQLWSENCFLLDASLFINLVSSVSLKHTGSNVVSNIAM